MFDKYLQGATCTLPVMDQTCLVSEGLSTVVQNHILRQLTVALDSHGLCRGGPGNGGVWKKFI